MNQAKNQESTEEPTEEPTEESREESANESTDERHRFRAVATAYSHKEIRQNRHGLRRHGLNRHGLKSHGLSRHILRRRNGNDPSRRAVQLFSTVTATVSTLLNNAQQYSTIPFVLASCHLLCTAPASRFLSCFLCSCHHTHATLSHGTRTRTTLARQRLGRCTGISN